MSRKPKTFDYSKDMKKLILTAALMLAAVGAGSPVQKFADPLPECPPACSDGGNVIAQVR
jgi:hypothetical protein